MATIKISKKEWEAMGKTSAYGDKRDYAKIDIFVEGKYKATTTWAKSLPEAKKQYCEKEKVDSTLVTCEYQKK